MKWVVYMFPKHWRNRYGDELIEVLKQTGLSFKVISDLLLSAINAWDLELSERDIYGYRISQILVAITMINVFIILKSKREGILMEQIASVLLVLGMVSLFLAILIFIASMFKFGVKEGISLKTKINKVAIGLMGVYAVTMGAFLIIIN